MDSNTAACLALDASSWLLYRVHPGGSAVATWDEPFLTCTYRRLIASLRTGNLISHHWFSRRGDFTRIRICPRSDRSRVQREVEDALGLAEQSGMIGAWDSKETGDPWDAGAHAGGQAAIMPWLCLMSSLSDATLELMALAQGGKLPVGWSPDRISHHWAHFVFNQLGLPQRVYAKCGCDSQRGLTSLYVSRCPDCGVETGICC